MNIELNQMQVLNLLDSIRCKLTEVKIYFEEHPNEEDRIGIVTPEEWKETYNSILRQCKEDFPMLTYIK